MAALRDEPLYSRILASPNGLSLEPGDVYLFGGSDEYRAAVIGPLAENSPQYVQIKEASGREVHVVGGSLRARLRSSDELALLLQALNARCLYLDITGLSHTVWVPLVKVALDIRIPLRAVYSEPLAYAEHPTPRRGEAFALSDDFGGIEPLPLFSSLIEGVPDRTTFVPLLGFEGPRLAHMLDELEPADAKTFPIIGVPGFQPSYPFYAYLGNGDALWRSRSYRHVRFAKSNCPFSAYYALDDLIRRNPDDHFKVGLIGTKPHALAAVLHARRGDASVELVYDHARRRKGRTSGIAQTLVYDLTAFLG